MREAFAWFLGANRLGLPLYDFATGGCRDGMGVSHVNQNQGAESTICFLMALLEMLELAGEGLEHADAQRRTRPASDEIHPDQAHAASAVARRTPRAGQAVPARRRRRCCPGVSRANLLMARILAIPEAEVKALNSPRSLRNFEARHRGFEAYARPAVRGGRAPSSRGAAALSTDRRLLDRRVLHARVRGRGRGALQPVDRARRPIRAASRAARSAS